MIRDGWKCPVCGRGVSPDKDLCDHNLSGVTFIPIPATSWPTYLPVPSHFDDGACAACRNGGVCNCYRPERGPFVIS